MCWKSVSECVPCEEVNKRDWRSWRSKSYHFVHPYGVFVSPALNETHMSAANAAQHSLRDSMIAACKLRRKAAPPELMSCLQDSVHASSKQLQELELQMHTVTASESLRDTLRAERTFAWQVQRFALDPTTSLASVCRPPLMLLQDFARPKCLMPTPRCQIVFAM